MAALPDPAAAREQIAAVLADRDFGSVREQPTWVRIDDQPRPRPQTLNQAPDDLGPRLGRALRALLVSAAVLVLAFLVWRILRDWQPPVWGRTRRPPGPIPTTVVGPAADPRGAALAAAVRARLAAGDARGALALLYRGAIAHLCARGLPIPEAATEGECLRLAAAHLAPDEHAPFARLTRDWQALAYAGAPPDPGRIAARLAEWLDWTGRRPPHPGAGQDPGRTP